ncbi:MAG: polysaccharide export protein [Verrucomicrobia bacterium]|nr:polysaccharide export protein [Verrucomicrobiota bacterium]
MHRRLFSVLYGLLACALFVAWGVPDARAQATLRNGDVLEIKISGIPSTDIASVSGQYTIDNEGFINLPYIGRVRVAGLSPGIAQSTIESVYRNRDIYTNPTITIGQQLQSRFVNVGGEVKTPQRIPYTADLTVLSSINAAGGFSPFADQRKVRLLRGSEVMVIDVKKIRGNPSLDIAVQPGDRIEVPQTLF